MSSGVVGLAGPAGFTNVTTMGDASLKADGEYAAQATAGSVDPRWTWFFHSPGLPPTWLATVLALNQAGQVQPQAAATQLAFTVQPSNATAGSTISPPVQVAARDGAGNTDATFSGTITVALGTNPSGGTLSGTRSVAAVNGVASFSNRSIDRAGSGYTLTATATGLTGATSASFTITAPPPPPPPPAGGIVWDTMSSALGQHNNFFIKGFNPRSPRPGDAIVVTVFWVGSGANIVDSVTDHLARPDFPPVGNRYHLVEYVSSDNISMATYVATNVQGYPYPTAPNVDVLAVRANLSRVAFGGIMMAAWSGVAGDFAQAVDTSMSRSGFGAASAEALVGPGAMPVNAGALGYAVPATARDAGGTPVSGVNVVLSATGSGNTLTQPAGPTNASGVATGTLSSTVAGTKTVSATAGGVAITQTAAVTVTAGGVSASQSTVTASPTSITAGSGTSTITVTARDANGNPVSGATVTLSATGSGNTLTQPAGPTNASGVATGTLSSTVPETKTISATAGGVAVTQTAAVTVTAGGVSASQSTVTASPTSITAGSGTSKITVTARDASGNPLSGVTVTLRATGPGNTLTQPAGPTNASGVATGTLSSTAAGSKTGTATAGGVTETQTASITVTAGPGSGTTSNV